MGPAYEAHEIPFPSTRRGSGGGGRPGVATPNEGAPGFMSMIDPAFVQAPPATARARTEATAAVNGHADLNGYAYVAASADPTAEALRLAAWEIGERKPADQFTPGH